jgi:hypothetical protein
MIMGSGGAVDSGGKDRRKQKRARGHAGPHRQDKVKAKSSGWRARDGEKEDERGATRGGRDGWVKGSLVNRLFTAFCEDNRSRSKQEEFKRSTVGLRLVDCGSPGRTATDAFTWLL